MTGEWGRFVDWFADDAVMKFRGPAVGPYTGKAAIALAYRENPPTDTIELAADTFTDGEELVVPYRWRATGELGTMRFMSIGGLVSRLVVTFD